ncbi:MAG: glycogen debranching protein GlgX [bacterium]|nr:glycogen debranching protein GlgX [bacterium]
MKGKKLRFFSGFTSRLLYGADIDGDGVYFSIFSRNASKVWLLLFDSADSDRPSHEIPLDPKINRTGDIRHIWVRGIKEGQLYLWRMDNPDLRSSRHCFSPSQLLIDPYARALTGNMEWTLENPNPVVYQNGAGAAGMPKCVVCSDDFDWEGDIPLNRPLAETVIYECHVRGLTAAKKDGAAHPGTYKGVVEIIPHLKELGITAVEFLPVQEFGAVQLRRRNPLKNEKVLNYWGYNTVCFFAPDGRYSSGGTMGEQVREFKYMVRELHKAGIEVILDIVFNHTGEGGKEGPAFSFKGIDNSIYYMVDPRSGEYLDYTGCGNTINCNHPVVKDFIISCLHYWVVQMHVDGFRFDLASVLGRDEQGNLLANPPLLRRIEEDPVLRDTKIIAEAWDAAGAYQVGEFTGRWGEWNGKFRDDVRRFWRGEKDSVGYFATRISGSSDLFGGGRTPHHSINFAFSHDGFTLKDWTSYNSKHNLHNAHNNEDGDSWNHSHNHGVEGETNNPRIKALRIRQAKNLFATLMLSLGVPMMLGGDEFLRTQQGNNNPYCQDNEISWFDWELVNKNPGMLRFAKEMICFRKRMHVLRKQSFYSGRTSVEELNPDIEWFGPKSRIPDWHGELSVLAALINGACSDEEHGHDTLYDLFIMFNADPRPQVFHVPPAPNGGQWRIAVKTDNPEPADIFSRGCEPPLPAKMKIFKLKGRSLAVLISPATPGRIDPGHGG